MSTPDRSDDEALAHRIAAGDRASWEQFFDRYSAWSYRLAYWHLNGNHADAEDLCSEIMMAAARSIDTYDPRRGDLDSWMHGLARKRLSHFCRSRKVRFPVVSDLVAPASDPGDGSRWATDIHLKDVVNRALATIPERQASALIAKYVDGYTTDELGERFGGSAKAAESLLVRARTAFRAAFNALLAGGTQ